MIAKPAFAQPLPSPPTTPSRKPAARMIANSMMKSKSAAMKREPIPASVSSTSTPSGVEMRIRSSYSIAR